jgi:hypothetical protein
MSHTPGPWSVGFDANSWEDGGVSVLADGRGMVCSITNKLNGLYQDRAGDGRLLTPRTIGHQEANARLIAAAPDLLAALIRMRDEFNSYADCPSKCDAVSMAFRAIEKAGGE